MSKDEVAQDRTTISRREIVSGGLGLAAAITAVSVDATSAIEKGGRKLPPPGTFLWGTATSAHQTEGNNVNADFWVAEHVKPALFKEPSGDACDSYHRYGEDISLAAKLGFNAYRFGIEWSRIEPEPGQFSTAELDHYVRMLEACHENGLAPMVTLSHWTVPRWFAARGGFEMSDSPELFARFAERVTARLGPLMSAATTFNEANIARVVAFLLSAQAKSTVADMLAACMRSSGSAHFANILFADLTRSEANQVMAHRKAVAAMQAGPGSFPVGLTISTPSIEGVGPDNKAEALSNAIHGPWWDAADPCDFVGVQTYTRVRVGADGPLPAPTGAEMTDAGYEFFPRALGSSIRYAAKRTGKPIYFTENGIATNDDARRIAYITDAIDEVRKARADGVDVRGYFHWSLLDNFEWTSGYAQRFGLIAVDRQSFKRTPKPSANYLGMIAKKDLA